MTRRAAITQVASTLPFDNETNGFTADTTQGAIEELQTKNAASANPGFSFGRNGNLNGGVYLYRPGNVVSSTSGINQFLYNAELESLSIVANTTSIFSIDIVQHHGSLTNLVVVTTVTVAGGARQYSIDLTGVTLVKDKQIAVRISTATANQAKDVGVDLHISGTTVP